MEEKVKVVIELDKEYIRSALLLTGVSGKDPKMAAQLLEKTTGEIILNPELLGDQKDQILFVFAVGAIGTIAAKLEKQEKEETKNE